MNDDGSASDLQRSLSGYLVYRYRELVDRVSRFLSRFD